MKILLLALLQVPLFFTTGNLPAACDPTSPSYFLKMSDFKVYTCTSSGNYSVVATPSTQIATQVPVVPPGSIMMILTGTCPAGYSESTVLLGRMLRGTTAAAGNVGTTGGSDSVTPTTNGISLTATAQTFTGTPFSSVINHTHTITNLTETQRAQGGTTASTTGTHLMTSTATGGSLRNSAQTTLPSTPTTNNPAGGVASITPAGTNGTSAVNGTITLNTIDNRAAYTNVIFCVKS